jgi:hypothetical protein
MITFSGPCSYKEHGLRMMKIWMEGLDPDSDPLELLYDSLTALGLKNAAGHYFQF